ncbi:MAG: hypothetical protein OQK75_00915, partial [Gammaproteobacteria bacterium]|nr:hypothetical protein [Gammaproteobacteria bacterium]
NHAEIEIPRGARMLSQGGHHVSVMERVSLSENQSERIVSVQAFYPGPEHNLDPVFVNTDGENVQKIDRWHPLDNKLTSLFEMEVTLGETLVEIEHDEKLNNGDKQWSDKKYRSLILNAPRSIWRVEAIEMAVSLIPGVRQVQIKDGWGGLDINQSIFGNFNFIERVFSGERDLGSPYYFSVLIAPTVDAIWEGPDGLRAAVESTIDDLRPISIFPQIEEASQIGVGIECNLIVKGLPLPTGSKSTVNSSIAAQELKKRLMLRLKNYIDGLKFGDPVRTSEVMWALMNEPGIADIQNLRLVRYPPGFDEIDFNDVNTLTDKTVFDCGQNIQLAVNEVPEFVDIDDGIIVI